MPANMEMVLKKYKVGIIALLLVIHFFLQVGSSLRESQTIDEGVHLAAGYSYLVQRDYRLNPEHPPLIKILSALPLLFLRPDFSLNDPAWIDAREWDFAPRFIYDNTVSGELLLQVGRLPNMFLALVLGAVVFWLARQYFGIGAGYLALIFYVFNPLFLAHGHYVTTDVGVALFFLLAVYFWGKYVEYHDRLSLLMATVFFALAQATKFSAVILLPIFIILFLIRRWQTVGRSGERLWFGFRNFLFSFLTIFILTVFVLALVYRGEWWFISGFPVPFPAYWEGLDFVARHNATGHLAFLFGNFSTSGWWYYFPLAFLLKTPLATLIVLFLAAIYWLKRFFLQSAVFISSSRRPFLSFVKVIRQMDFSFFVLLIPPFFYMLWSMTSNINLGVRHLTPMYPFLFIFLGSLSLVRFVRGQYLWRGILASLLVIQIGMTFLTYPHFISYYSEAVGGSKNGYRYLLDSNTDWGQGLKSLNTYLQQQSIDQPIYLAALNTVDPRYYGVDWRSFPEEASFGSFELLPPGMYVLAASYALTGDLQYQWLLDVQPTVQVADVYFVYDRR